jgi:hypothetical protein
VHAGDTTADRNKSPYFSTPSKFLVGTGTVAGFAPPFPVGLRAGVSMRQPVPFQGFTLSVGHPFIDRIHIKTEIAADFETRNVTLANESVDRAPMNLQILSYLDSCHHERVICGSVAGLHFGMNFQ